MKKRTRLSPEVRRATLIQCGIQSANEVGLTNVRHSSIKDKHTELFAPISMGTTFNYFKTPEALQRALVEEILINDVDHRNILVLEACFVVIRMNWQDLLEPASLAYESCNCFWGELR